jgi:hypothetical protein
LNLAVNAQGLESSSDAGILFDHFVNGSGTSLLFSSQTGMSSVIAKETSFIDYRTKFERAACDYYNQKGSIEGFDFGREMAELGTPSLTGAFYAKAVIGGTKQWSTQIQAISSTRITVKYTVTDIFGAGTEDANRLWVGPFNYPGLSSMYWLQHNSAHYYPEYKNNYRPFVWSAEILHIGRNIGKHP